MENIYQKTFTTLMEGKKVLYVHGFGSAGSTHTAQLLRDYMPNATVLSPDLPVRPEEAMALLRETVAREQPDLIIGTSMGGMYTEMLYGYDRICVNPAFQMGETMQEHGMTGKQTFQNPRQDGVQEFIVTKALVKEYKAMTENNFSQVTADEQHRVYGLFGDNDEVVHTYDLFLEHYPQAIHFHGEHRLNETVLLHYLIPVIRWIDDQQRGHERPTVFIDFDTMHDSYMKPVSCLRKAYEFLIENYNVYIVAPAPSAQPETMLQTMTWVEEYINVPAWNRVIFTNSKQQLLGDYYLAPLNPPEGGTFFGTVLEFGKDELKTYEDVITFFERMGGQ